MTPGAMLMATYENIMKQAVTIARELEGKLEALQVASKLAHQLRNVAPAESPADEAGFYMLENMETIADVLARFGENLIDAMEISITKNQMLREKYGVENVFDLFHME